MLPQGNKHSLSSGERKGMSSNLRASHKEFLIDLISKKGFGIF